MKIIVQLEGGPPWGFRTAQRSGDGAVFISQVVTKGKAFNAGMKIGDVLERIQGSSERPTYEDVQKVLAEEGCVLLELVRTGSTDERKKSEIPNGEPKPIDPAKAFGYYQESAVAPNASINDVESHEPINKQFLAQKPNINSTFPAAIFVNQQEQQWANNGLSSKGLPYSGGFCGTARDKKRFFELAAAQQEPPTLRTSVRQNTTLLRNGLNDPQITQPEENILEKGANNVVSQENVDALAPAEFCLSRNHESVIEDIIIQVPETVHIQEVIFSPKRSPKPVANDRMQNDIQEAENATQVPQEEQQASVAELRQKIGAQLKLKPKGMAAGCKPVPQVPQKPVVWQGNPYSLTGPTLCDPIDSAEKGLNLIRDHNFDDNYCYQYPTTDDESTAQYQQSQYSENRKDSSDTGFFSNESSTDVKYPTFEAKSIPISKREIPTVIPPPPPMPEKRNDQVNINSNFHPQAEPPWSPDIISHTKFVKNSEHAQIFSSPPHFPSPVTKINKGEKVVVMAEGNGPSAAEGRSSSSSFPSNCSDYNNIMMTANSGKRTEFCGGSCGGGAVVLGAVSQPPPPLLPPHLTLQAQLLEELKEDLKEFSANENGPRKVGSDQPGIMTNQLLQLPLSLNHIAPEHNSSTLSSSSSSPSHGDASASSTSSSVITSGTKKVESATPPATGSSRTYEDRLHKETDQNSKIVMDAERKSAWYREMYKQLHCVDNEKATYHQNGFHSSVKQPPNIPPSKEDVLQKQKIEKLCEELEDQLSRKHGYLPSSTPSLQNNMDRFDQLMYNFHSRSSRSRSSTPLSRSNSSNRQVQTCTALYKFVGEGPRELSLNRGDVVRLHRQLDDNWFEGERNGQMGIFPASYVQVDESTPSVRLRAVYQFHARNANELNLIRGETIHQLREIDQYWVEGRNSKGKIGIFPKSYVLELDSSDAKPSKSISFSEVLVNGTDSTPDRPKTPKIISSSIRAASPSATPSRSQAPHAPEAPAWSHPSSATALTTTATTPASPLTAGSSAPAHFVPRNAETYRAIYPYKPVHGDELGLLEEDIVFVVEKCDDGWFIGSLLRNGQFGTFPGNYVVRH